ncbi:hypothetical protein [Pedococcus soli]
MTIPAILTSKPAKAAFWTSKWVVRGIVAVSILWLAVLAGMYGGIIGGLLISWGMGR